MTFVEPLFLFAAAAGAIPVLLHMIHRQQASVVPFSTLRFLAVSVQRTRRRKYIHDWLLLLLRIAALVLIAVALARPFWTSSASLFRMNARTAVVIILDNSASMATVVGGTPRFERAVDVAEQLVAQLRPGDDVALLVTGGPQLPIQQKLYTDHEIILQALGECRVSLQGADLASKIQEARRLLQTPEYANREIIVITDLQKRSWNAEAPSRSDGKGTAEPSMIPVLVVDVRKSEVPNGAIGEVRVTQSAAVAKVPMEVTVQVVNHSAVRQAKHLELHIDGVRQATSPVIELEPGHSAHHVFTVTIDRPGIHRGTIRLLDEDALKLDDRHHFAILLRDRLRVAVVESRHHAVPFLDAAFYLKEALHVVSDEWALELDAWTVDELSGRSLADYDVIFCVDLPADRLGDVASLEQYVRQGGHLFWVAGEEVVTEAYNAMNRRAGGALLPLELGERRKIQGDGAESPCSQEVPHIGWLDEEYEALRPLANPASLYQSVFVRTFISVRVDSEKSARVLARVGEEPLLIERRVGEGRVIWLGTTMHTNWTNLPLKPIFLPLVARMTFHLASSDAQCEDIVAGTVWSFSLGRTDKLDRWEIRRPDGEVIVQPPVPPGESLQYADTFDAGVYEVRLLGPKRADRAFSINVDRTESDASYWDAEELEAKLGKKSVTVIADGPDVLQAIHRVRQGGSLWELLLAAVLVALVAEALVANQKVNGTSADVRTKVPGRSRAAG